MTTFKLLTRATPAACILLLPALLALSPLPARAEVEFIYHEDTGFYELRASDTSLNEILRHMEEILMVPINPLLRDRAIPFVHTRSKDLDKVLNSICETHVIIYSYDDQDRPIMEAIEVTAVSGAGAPPSAQPRAQVIRDNRLNERMPAEPPQNIVYAGIGAYLQPTDDRQAIWLRPMSPDTPAARAGIQLGDRAIAIDGKPVADFPDQSSIANAIRGPVNSYVSLLILRPDETQITLSVQRAMIHNKTAP